MERAAIITFGCQMNKHDSERLEEVLLRAGYEMSHAERAEEAGRDADVVVLNTCSVRDKADQKLRSEVGRLALIKRSRPELTVVVAGCMAQIQGAQLLRSAPAVDLVLGPDNIGELPELLADIRLGGAPQVRTVFDVEEPRFLTASSVVAGRPTAFVTTMKGCNERCSFCVVPHTRGPERYRASEAIIQEIAQLVASGVREVTLLGQTVNSYRDESGALAPAPEARADDPDESAFAALLRAIAAEVPDLRRLRYTSPHPRHLTPSLIAAHRDLEIMPRHIHLPVQSGNDLMLKRMIRRHSRQEYCDRIARFRNEVEGATVSTDIIVGFCGETEAQFVETLSLIEEVGHVGVFAFKYSPRPHTPALLRGDDVPESVKSERLQRVFEISERLMAEHLNSMVGSKQQVLVEGPSKARPENLSGRSQRNEIVHIEGISELDAVGAVVEVEIVQAYKHSLRAQMGAAARAKLSQKPLVSEPKRRSLPLMDGGAQ